MARSKKKKTGYYHFTGEVINDYRMSEYLCENHYQQVDQTEWDLKVPAIKDKCKECSKQQRKKAA